MAQQQEAKKTLDEIKQMFGIVPTWVTEMPEPAVVGFWNLMRDFQLGESVIPNKYKELIGVAVAGATRCRYCSLFHTEAAKLEGATEAEIAEASTMGAVTMFGSTFLNGQQIDYERFAKETRQIVDHIRKQQRGTPGPRAQA